MENLVDQLREGLTSGLVYPMLVFGICYWFNRKMQLRRKEQEDVYHHQMEEIAKKQQREAERDLKIEKLINGVLASLRDRIMQSCNFFISQGEITPLALENIAMMHDAYKALGGNGLCDKQFDEVNKLPVEVFKQKSNKP